MLKIISSKCINKCVESVKYWGKIIIKKVKNLKYCLIKLINLLENNKMLTCFLWILKFDWTIIKHSLIQINQ